jgi:hypothetical protein
MFFMLLMYSKDFSVLTRSPEKVQEHVNALAVELVGKMLDKPLL